MVALTSALVGLCVGLSRWTLPIVGVFEMVKKASQPEQPAIVRKNVVLEEKQVPLNLIHWAPEVYSFRSEDELNANNERLKELVESITANGLLEPWLLKDQGDGRYLVSNCHRRKKAVDILIEQKVSGFSRRHANSGEGHACRHRRA